MIYSDLVCHHIFYPASNDVIKVDIVQGIVGASCPEDLSLIDINDTIKALEKALEYYQALYDQKSRETDSFWV